MGTVLKPRPDIWDERQDRAALLLRRALLSELQDRWGDALTEQHEHLIREASLRDLHLWLRRVRYVTGLVEVFDPRFKLAAEYIDLERLIYHALGVPIDQWGISLTFKGSSRAPKSPEAISEDVPWIDDLRRAPAAIAGLRRQGWILVVCASFEEAETLRSIVRTSRIQVTLFRSDGSACC